MEKIDTIELVLSEIGYQRKTENIGYHPTLSRSVSSFRHSLKPLDFFESLYRQEEQENQPEQGVLTAKKVYTYDSFFTHSKQYGESTANIEVPFRIKDGLASFLFAELDNSKEAANSAYDKKTTLWDRMLGRGVLAESFTSSRRRSGELFSNEDDAINIFSLYVNKCGEMVSGNSPALKRLGILAEISGFKQMEDLAIIAKDTSDSDIELFLSFLAKNKDMDIVIKDYKQAYNVFTMVDKSQLMD